MELRILVPFTGLVTLAILCSTAAAQTSSASSTPGCYTGCTFLNMDYDPGRTEDMCDKDGSLGSLFLKNLKSCANCIREEGHLSSYFDVGDAQDALQMVNLCQSLYTNDHSEMVSAMSVILETGSVIGSISPTKTPTPTPTSTQTSESETTTDTSSPAPTGSTQEQSASQSRAWVAGPVVGSVAGVSGIIGAAFLIIRRRNQRQKARSTAEEDGGSDRPSDKPYDKPELSADERVHHELDGQNHVETEARAPPQELNSGEVVELPADNGK